MKVAVGVILAPVAVGVILAPVAAALATLLPPVPLLVLTVQHAPGCFDCPRYPWAWPAFLAAVVLATGLAALAWVVPPWRRRHLAQGATLGLALLAVLTVFILGESF